MISRLKSLTFLLLTLLALDSGAAERQVLQRHVPAAAARLQPVRRLPASETLQLTLCLPWRNCQTLTNLLQELYDPASTNYHRFLTAEDFASKFGPTEQDYQAMIGYAQANGLKVQCTHPNRMLLGVTGSVDAIERALSINLHSYAHPKEPRLFFAPDKEPSLDLAVPLVHVGGLNNYKLPRPMSRPAASGGPAAKSVPRTGSGPSGNYMGNDFRAAYVPGTTLTGVGQSVALVEFDGFYAGDITAYRNLTGLPNVPIVTVLVNGFSGAPSSFPSTGNEEVALDIEVAIAMAPGLSQVLVYESAPASSMASTDNMLNLIATDNLAKQISCSWGFDIDLATQQIFQQYAAQGQSFYLASGDNGAFVGAVEQPSDDPYITVVGGTVLTTSSSHTWLSETTWNGSGGGISTVYSIPTWQQGISMTANQGSTTMRNLPDVAMVASDVWVRADNGGALALVGTSISAPLWAGLTALINQQAATQGKPPVGFINPALYAIGKGAGYTTAFHDITTGKNTSATSPSSFFATSGFDLCTGWGTPRVNLINALLSPPVDPLQIQSPLGFTAFGPVGGPFNVTSQTLTLTNTGVGGLNWALGNTAAWLDVSLSAGTLTPGGPAASVVLTLNTVASNFLIGTYTANVSITNLNTHVVQLLQFNLLVGNGGFETGDFSNWTLSANASTNFVYAISIDYAFFNGGPAITGINDSRFVHTGIYGAFLGQSTVLGYLSQNLPTVAGQSYLLSFWLTNPTNNTPNEFLVSWNGTNLFDQANLGSFGWTNFQYVVKATGPTTPLQFGFRNDPKAFGLDDITVQLVPQPVIQSVSATNGILGISWTTLPGVGYQLQATPSLSPINWINLGSLLQATNGILRATDSINSSPARFYRVVVP